MAHNVHGMLSNITSWLTADLATVGLADQTVFATVGRKPEDVLANGRGGSQHGIFSELQAVMQAAEEARTLKGDVRGALLEKFFGLVAKHPELQASGAHGVLRGLAEPGVKIAAAEDVTNAQKDGLREFSEALLDGIFVATARMESQVVQDDVDVFVDRLVQRDRSEVIQRLIHTSWALPPLLWRQRASRLMTRFLINVRELSLEKRRALYRYEASSARLLSMSGMLSRMTRSGRISWLSEAST